jgi:hypothetical protein
MDRKILSVMVVLLCGLLLPVSRAFSQERPLPLSQLALTDLSAFKPATPNWRLAGDVFYDPDKGGKARLSPGSGVLVNVPAKSGNGHLFTTLEHGDLELELDFMMAKGSNSGIYLQGRYEVQLFDSWGLSSPKASDCGGIYERWDESRPEGQKGYEGHPPAQNVSRAPGLWQQLRIVFRAPRFDARGRKTEAARFVKVQLNGVTIHENVALTGPTRSAAFTDEKPLGPLMIQGDHGPVAIRNIRYQAYGTEPVTLANLKLTAYEGKFKSLEDFNTQPPKAEMDIDVLAHLAPASRDEFAGKITGTLRVPASGAYYLHLHLAWIPMDTHPDRINGAGQLTLDDKQVLTVTGRTGIASAMVQLAAGEHPITLSYFKSSSYWYARSNDITLSVAGPGVAYTALATPLRAAEPVSPITVLVSQEPELQRGFVEHQGRKHTHTISVGEPGQVNYSLDLQSGELLQVWRGGFLETTPMWHGRGETQLSVPLGSVIPLSGKPALALLADEQAAWPDSNAAFTYLGYELSPAGRPVFRYALAGAQVRESLEPEAGGKKLVHTFTVTPGPQTKDLWCRVAAGTDITRMPNGYYAVNGKQYFIQLPKKVKPVIRSTAGNQQELLLPVKVKNNMGEVKYSIVW